MDKQVILQETEQWVKKRLMKDATGHDYWHIKRVYSLTETIAKVEKGDTFICRMAALLHDIPDEKLTDSVHQAKEEVNEILHSFHLSQSLIDSIWSAMDISFKGNHRVPMTLEGKIVQDADRLDAIGAIGIARTFAYGGSKGSPMHDPTLPEEMANVSYRSKGKTTIQHFYEKLLKLKGYMNTRTGEKIAEERHQFMELYLKTFYKEWNGEDIRI
ncbi:HD domain-containing protein [Salirhabdus salicampi]|uniref:HD domain-containing protein n=1 Tax=Salirhabdus salicampi TaxID=476102 RepID=UPI0020C5811C|nr:HD domain-containing protein [Salirhabdus salicampi]MCP8616086.1 HD domain-containing protein [Salirhabdus salicampi]